MWYPDAKDSFANSAVRPIEGDHYHCEDQADKKHGDSGEFSLVALEFFLLAWKGMDNAF
jgi:hypothetical protein